MVSHYIRIVCSYFMAIRGGKSGSRDFLFVGSKITADGGCSHEIRRRLLLGRKAVTNLDSVLKSRDITLLAKVRNSQGYDLPSDHTQLWELDHKEDRAPNNWCLRTVVLEKTPETPLDSKEIKLVNLKGNQPWILFGRTGAEAETPAFGYLMCTVVIWCAQQTHWKKPLMLGKIEGRSKKGHQRMDGWMASPMQWTWTWVNFRRWWGTGRLVFCSPWACRVWHD